MKTTICPANQVLKLCLEHPSEKKSKIKSWKGILICSSPVKGNRKNCWGAWIALISSTNLVALPIKFIRKPSSCLCLTQSSESLASLVSHYKTAGAPHHHPTSIPVSLQTILEQPECTFQNWRQAVFLPCAQLSWTLRVNPRVLIVVPSHDLAPISSLPHGPPLFPSYLL